MTLAHRGPESMLDRLGADLSVTIDIRLTVAFTLAAWLFVKVVVRLRD